MSSDPSRRARARICPRHLDSACTQSSLWSEAVGKNLFSSVADLPTHRLTRSRARRAPQPATPRARDARRLTSWISIRPAVAHSVASPSPRVSGVSATHTVRCSLVETSPLDFASAATMPAVLALAPRAPASALGRRADDSRALRYRMSSARSPRRASVSVRAAGAPSPSAPPTRTASSQGWARACPSGPRSGLGSTTRRRCRPSTAPRRSP